MWNDSIPMATDKVHLRHCILYEFQQEMLQKHVEIYWKCLVKVQFLRGHAEDEKFEIGDFDLSDKPRSGRPSLIDNDVGARSFSDDIGDRRKA